MLFNGITTGFHPAWKFQSSSNMCLLYFVGKDSEVLPGLNGKEWYQQLVMSAMGMGEGSISTCAVICHTHFGKGLACFISSLHFLAMHFNLLLENWAHQYHSSGDSDKLLWFLTHMAQFWFLSSSRPGCFFATLFQLKRLEWITGLGINAGWYQYWLGKINCITCTI